MTLCETKKIKIGGIMTNNQNSQCQCIKQKNEVNGVAKNYDLRKLSLSDIVKILLKVKANLPRYL